MEPNQGTVAGGFRLLVSSSSTGSQHWYWWLVSLASMLQGDADRHLHELRVLSASSEDLLAVRSFDRAAKAKRARDRFVELVEQGEVSGSEPADVQRFLNSLAVD